MSWRNYQRTTESQNLARKLYTEEPNQIVYPGAESEMTVACIASPWKGLPIPYWVFSIGAPIVIAYAFVSPRVFEKSGGSHGVFIVLSILSLPMSNGILGQFLTRTIFFMSTSRGDSNVRPARESFWGRDWSSRTPV